MVRRNSGGICERKTLFWMKKEADQAGFKGTRTGLLPTCFPRHISSLSSFIFLFQFQAHERAFIMSFNTVHVLTCWGEIHCHGRALGWVLGFVWPGMLQKDSGVVAARFFVREGWK